MYMCVIENMYHHQQSSGKEFNLFLLRVDFHAYCYCDMLLIIILAPYSLFSYTFPSQLQENT